MENKKVAEEWFSIARVDLDSAIYLCDMKPLPKEIICYHCQQAAEKMLKGYIAYNGGQIIKTHDLIVLNKICKRYNEKFNELTPLCIELVDYGVNVRYPYHIEINDDDIYNAIDSAKIIKKFIDEIL